jgi:hypothetical protein
MLSKLFNPYKELYQTVFFISLKRETLCFHSFVTDDTFVRNLLAYEGLLVLSVYGWVQSVYSVCIRGFVSHQKGSTIYPSYTITVD